MVYAGCLGCLCAVSATPSPVCDEAASEWTCMLLGLRVQERNSAVATEWAGSMRCCGLKATVTLFRPASPARFRPSSALHAGSPGHPAVHACALGCSERVHMRGMRESGGAAAEWHLHPVALPHHPSFFLHILYSFQFVL